MYSKWCALRQGVTRASLRSSMARKKMSAATTGFGIYPGSCVPKERTPKVAMAKRAPAVRLSPPLRMNKTVLVYTR